jgi:hypothetical protein
MTNRIKDFLPDPPDDKPVLSVELKALRLDNRRMSPAAKSTNWSSRRVGTRNERAVRGCGAFRRGTLCGPVGERLYSRRPPY